MSETEADSETASGTGTGTGTGTEAEAVTEAVTAPGCALVWRDVNNLPEASAAIRAMHASWLGHSAS